MVMELVEWSSMMNMATGGMTGAAAQGPWQQAQNAQNYHEVERLFIEKGVDINAD